MKFDSTLPSAPHRRHLLATGLSLLVAPLVTPFVTPVAAKPQNIPLPQLNKSLIMALAGLDHIAGAPFSRPDGKVAVVTFFASWCPPCRTEFRHLSAVQRHYPASDLNIIAINLFETWSGQSNAARLDRFLKDTKPPFTVIRGNDRISERFGGITRIPTLLVFDRQGRMAYRFIHKTGATKQQVEETELRRVINGVL